jgi:hypothetical protein
MTGSAITALSSSGGDCRFPLNINDTDLNVHAKDPPTPYVGPTEMLFVLTRLEMTVAAAPNSIRPAAGLGNKPRVVQYSPSPSSPDMISHVANQNLPQDLDAYCNYIEAVYLKACDPKVPLHLFTMLMTRQALCKLRVVAFMCRGVSTETLEPAEKDALFAQGVQALELDNMMQSSESLAGFTWYMAIFFPFPIYMFVVSELRRRHTGELAERAWEAIIENHERRGLIRNLRSPLHMSFGNLFIKAWEAREAAELQLGRSLQTPKLVTLLRQHMNRYGPQKPPRQPQAQSAHVGSAGGDPSVAATAATTTPPAGMPGSGHDTPEQPGHGGFGLDDNMMFSPYDGGNPMLTGGMGGGDGDFGQVDWNYLMQYSGFGGTPFVMGPGHQMHPGVQQ